MIAPHRHMNVSLPSTMMLCILSAACVTPSVASKDFSDERLPAPEHDRYPYIYVHSLSEERVRLAYDKKALNAFQDKFVVSVMQGTAKCAAFTESKLKNCIVESMSPSSDVYIKAAVNLLSHIDVINAPTKPQIRVEFMYELKSQRKWICTIPGCGFATPIPPQ